MWDGLSRLGALVKVLTLSSQDGDQGALFGINLSANTTYFANQVK